MMVWASPVSRPTGGTGSRSWPSGPNGSAASWKSDPDNLAAPRWRWTLVRPRDRVASRHHRGWPKTMASPMPTDHRTQVLLVDDHDLIRKGLRHAFEGVPAFEVVGDAARAGGRVPA